MVNNFSERIVSARKMAGLSLQDLADKLEAGITRQALNKYEHGKARPSGEVLTQIANALNVPVDYFYREVKVELDDIDFRKHTRLPKKDIERVKAECCDFLERYLELEDLLGIQSSFENPIITKKIKSKEDIERASVELRQAWGLGTGPLPGLVELFEEKKIKLMHVDAPETFSGMSTWVKDIPVIVLNKNFPSQRSRFTALHELAHLILDLSAFDEKQEEKMCHEFAGAMLLPKGPFLEIFGEKRSSVTEQELKIIDEQYGVSVQAIMARAYSLKVISDTAYRDFNTWLNKTGKRNKEFVQYHCQEQPLRFMRLIYKAVSENVISMSKAAALANMKLADFRDAVVAVR